MRIRSLLSWSLLAILCVLWWWSQENTSTHDHAIDETKPPLLILDDATVYLYDEQGQRNHRIHAVLSEYHNDGSGTFLIQPTIEHYASANKYYISTAQKGFIDDAQSRIDLRDDVLVKQYETDKPVSRLDTSALSYFVDTEELCADGPIDYRDNNSQIQANSALWRLRQNSLILEQNIRTHYEPPHSKP